MAHRYEYPVIGGMTWNLSQKCELALGIKPAGIARTGARTWVTFDVELTPQQKTDLDAIMAADPIGPTGFVGFLDTAGNDLYIGDIFDKDVNFDAWVASLGISGLQAVRLFIEGDPVGSPGDYNRIVVKFNKLLTVPERKKVEDGYKDNFGWGSL